MLARVYVAAMTDWQAPGPDIRLLLVPYAFFVAGSVQRNDAHAAASRRAVVLAGGLGTRLQPYTTVLPKPLMPIGDRPVLDIVVRQLRRHGFDRVTIATGHLAELIEAFFGDGASTASRSTTSARSTRSARSARWR